MIPEEMNQDPVVAAIAERFPQAIQEAKGDLGELTLVIAAEHLVEVCRLLKAEQKFVRLSSVTGVDWMPRDPRLEVVYHLEAVERKLRLRLKVWAAGEPPTLDSVTSVWRGADWYEREVFDLFGVVFRNHPDMRRIMMPDNWEGHPLRKDFPVHGYKYSYADQE
ncbi:MAG: NADH-quinone oxidoreductase subunit C [Bryobacterales bacterium]|nr:NADH-quinone oxidoreductase subunit C [Bryobacterales bacterium]